LTINEKISSKTSFSIFWYFADLVIFFLSTVRVFFGDRGEDCYFFAFGRASQPPPPHHHIANLL
jgi:hypothetical protein